MAVISSILIFLGSKSTRKKGWCGLMMKNTLYNNLPKVFYFNSYFYPQLKKGMENVKLWSMSFGDIFDLDYLFITINILDIHWTVVVVDFKERTINYYDSFHGKNNECTKSFKSFFN
eukprot:TRINITY_DN3745_c0_g1_i1.p1 TRINITY_DN3745_c0_g1~~TRINITY_DN3745_c0_g1_i1.p1  ORF type:complete len:117 (+),score=6.67 TRINITY_DN3745_c0_g1_i1:622-972(+)